MTITNDPAGSPVAAALAGIRAAFGSWGQALGHAPVDKQPRHPAELTDEELLGAV